jgi:hypothetical protein
LNRVENMVSILNQLQYVVKPVLRGHFLDKEKVAS